MRLSLDNAFTLTTMRGRVRIRKDDEYEVRITFKCTLSTLGWVILVLGVLFVLAGALIILVPMMKKDDIAKRVRRALRDSENE